MKRHLMAGVLGVIVVLAVTACSDDNGSASEDATKAAGELCTDISELKADNAKLKALDPASATKDQVEEAVAAIRDDWDSIKENAATMRESERTAVQDAAEDLKKSYDDLPDDTTGRDALAQLQPQIQKLDETATAAATSLSC
ncbi:hypothetical protein ABZ946_23350 [Streptomyces sp. NPDC046324]|uniref:hypothetical protein n=1 Tax=Streptomyces sp. NPDC046324 TaxID=3154915 RepID=UPI003407B8D8